MVKTRRTSDWLLQRTVRTESAVSVAGSLKDQNTAVLRCNKPFSKAPCYVVRSCRQIHSPTIITEMNFISKWLISLSIGHYITGTSGPTKYLEVQSFECIFWPFVR